MRPGDRPDRRVEDQRHPQVPANPPVDDEVPRGDPLAIDPGAHFDTEGMQLREPPLDGRRASRGRGRAAAWSRRLAAARVGRPAGFLEVPDIGRKSSRRPRSGPASPSSLSDRPSSWDGHSSCDRPWSAIALVFRSALVSDPPSAPEFPLVSAMRNYRHQQPIQGMSALPAQFARTRARDGPDIGHSKDRRPARQPAEATEHGRRGGRVARRRRSCRPVGQLSVVSGR